MISYTFLMYGNSTSGTFLVQSLPSETINCGLGAWIAATSAWFVTCGTSPGGPCSHRQPVCVAETITTGIDTFTRSSTAASMNVCVPPPDSPVMLMLPASTSGRVQRKSTQRIRSSSCSENTAGPG